MINVILRHANHHPKMGKLKLQVKQYLMKKRMEMQTRTDKEMEIIVEMEIQMQLMELQLEIGDVECLVGTHKLSA